MWGRIAPNSEVLGPKGKWWLWPYWSVTVLVAAALLMRLGIGPPIAPPLQDLVHATCDRMTSTRGMGRTAYIADCENGISITLERASWFDDYRTDLDTCVREKRRLEVWQLPRWDGKDQTVQASCDGRILLAYVDGARSVALEFWELGAVIALMTVYSVYSLIAWVRSIRAVT
jgi:hypothetical protein